MPLFPPSNSLDGRLAPLALERANRGTHAPRKPRAIRSADRVRSGEIRHQKQDRTKPTLQPLPYFARCFAKSCQSAERPADNESSKRPLRSTEIGNFAPLERHAALNSIDYDMFNEKTRRYIITSSCVDCVKTSKPSGVITPKSSKRQPKTPLRYTPGSTVTTFPSHKGSVLRGERLGCS